MEESKRALNFLYLGNKSTGHHIHVEMKCIKSPVLRQQLGAQSPTLDSYL